MPLPPELIKNALQLFETVSPKDKLAFIDHNGKEFYMSIFNQAGQTVTNQVNEDRDPWISVSDYQPKGSPIVFMYSESVNEFSCGHFVLNRAGVPVTHWMPCVAPKR